MNRRLLVWSRHLRPARDRPHRRLWRFHEATRPRPCDYDGAMQVVGDEPNHIREWRASCSPRRMAGGFEGGQRPLRQSPMCGVLVQIRAFTTPEERLPVILAAMRSRARLFCSPTSRSNAASAGNRICRSLRNSRARASSKAACFRRHDSSKMKRSKAAASRGPVRASCRPSQSVSCRARRKTSSGPPHGGSPGRQKMP